LISSTHEKFEFRVFGQLVGLLGRTLLHFFYILAFLDYNIFMLATKRHRFVLVLSDHPFISQENVYVGQDTYSV